MDTQSPEHAQCMADLTVGDLERLLFEVYPASDALYDDRNGLLVGDPLAKVGSIAIALDAMVDTIEVAAAYGCNVLITHHPVFWNPPTLFLREVGTNSANGAAQLSAAAVYRAAEKGVALISMHTNLDCAPSAADMLLGPVGYEYVAPLALPSELTPDLTAHPTSAQAGVPKLTREPQQRVAGFGQLGKPRTCDRSSPSQPATLEELAQRYVEVFGAVAKVWGDPATSIEVLATCSGGGGELVDRVIASHADCYVTGEVRYHEALELASAGVALIELGHDRSEAPYRYYLQDTLLGLGFDAARIHIIELLTSWWQPERSS